MGEPSGWFLMWLVFGGCLAIGTISLGPLVTLPVAGLATFMAVRWPRSRGSLFGLVSGAGILLLVIAYLNRQGPFNPLHWLLAGVVLVVAGVAAQLRSH